MRSIFHFQEATITMSELQQCGARSGFADLVDAVITASGREVCRIYIIKGGKHMALVDEEFGQVVYFTSFDLAVRSLLDIPGLNTQVKMDLISLQGYSVGRKRELNSAMQAFVAESHKAAKAALDVVIEDSAVYHFEAVKA